MKNPDDITGMQIQHIMRLLPVLTEPNRLRKASCFFIPVILLVAFFWIYSYNTSTPYFRTPDENSNYIFSLEYSQTGDMFYKEPLNEVVGNVVAPISGRITESGRIVPKKYLGFPLICGTAMTVDQRMSSYLTPLAACATALVLYIMSRRLFGKRNAIITGMLLLVFPPFWYWSNSPLFETILGVFFLVFGLYYYFKALDEPRPSHYVLLALFLGMAFAVRQDIVLVFLPLTVILLVNIKRVAFRYVPLSMAVFLFAVFPVLVLSNQLFGGYFNTGQRSESGVGDFTGAAMAGSREFSALWPNLEYYFEMGYVFILAVVIGLVFLLIKRRRKKGEGGSGRSYAFFILASYLIYVIIHQMYPPPNYSFGKPVHESFIRYLMPIMVASLPLLALFIAKLGRLSNTRIIPVVVMFVFVVTSVLYVMSDRGLNELWTLRLKQERVSECIQNNTEPDALILIGIFERTVYPERRVIPAHRLVGEDNEEKITMMVQIAGQAVDHEIPIYLYKYHHEVFDDFALMQGLLSQKGMVLELVSDNGRDIGRLYRITKGIGAMVTSELKICEY